MRLMDEGLKQAFQAFPWYADWIPHKAKISFLQEIAAGQRAI